MAKMRAVDAAMYVLEKEGITTAFGVPGAAINPFYSAMRKHGGIRHILARHVEGASHMAEGYTRATAGNIGVCLGTSGPAGTDMITALYSASADSIPSSQGQEDHVSMGANAATKLVRVGENTERVLAIELFNAAQALEFRRPLKSSWTIEKIFAKYRKVVPFIDDDVYMHPLIEKSMNEKQTHKVGERILGTDPQSGRQVSVKIGRFGPMAQIGVASEGEKPKFAQLQKGMSIDTVTLDEALALFALPRTLGEWEGGTVVANVGRFGPYVQLGKEFVSLPVSLDPLQVTLEEAIAIIENKRKNEQKRLIKTFEENPEIEVLNGRYGPYIAKNGKNYKIPSGIDPASLDLATCLDIIEKAAEKPVVRRKRK